MTDELDTMTDGELSEAFAVEVAGWSCVSRRHGNVCARENEWRNARGEPVSFYSEGNFAKSADAVLPFITRDTVCHYVPADGLWHLRDCGRQWPEGFAEAPSLARCACILSLRAKRAQKCQS